MNSNIGSAFSQCDFEFFDKLTFTAHLAEASVQNLIALGGHAQKLNGIAAGLQDGLDMLSLPHGQATFARGNDDRTLQIGCGSRVQTSNLFVIFEAIQMLACNEP